MLSLVPVTSLLPYGETIYVILYSPKAGVVKWTLYSVSYLYLKSENAIVVMEKKSKQTDTILLSLNDRLFLVACTAKLTNYFENTNDPAVLLESLHDVNEPEVTGFCLATLLVVLHLTN